MNLTIYDTTFGIISKEEKGPCFLVDSTYRQDFPTEDDKMLIVEAGKGNGCYAAYSNIFAKIPSEDVYSYQTLLPPSDKITAILTDRINGKYIILTACINGIYVGSRTFESNCSDGDFRRFCSSFGVPLDAPNIEISEYSKPKRPAAFQEPRELLLDKRKKRTETLLLSLAALIASVGIIYYGILYFEHLKLTTQRKELQATIAELSSRVPKENIDIYDRLDSDEMTIRYLRELDRIGPSSLASITADGAVFASHKSLEELRSMNKQIKPVEAERFFLQMPDPFKLPVDSK